MSPVTPASRLFDLSGEVAFVTGASSGLGARFATVLAAHGARVVLAARRADRIAALAAELGAAIAVTLDVTDAVAGAAAFDAAERAFGPVTLLVNNAGTATAGRFIKADAADWRRVQATNVDAVWQLSQTFARRAIASGVAGSIVNIASVAAYSVTGTALPYTVSKAAVVQLTRAMALELARHGIRVNGIAPGYIASEMTGAFLASEAGQAMIKRVPQRRAGDPCDLDGTLLLLASRNASGFMTGTVIIVDGGLLLT